jgi:ribosomal protein S18 acetylase RimI-like enzyme
LINVREATPEDTEAIVAVTAAGWREAYRGIVSPEKLADLPIERWRHEIGVGLRRPIDDAFTCVAELEGAFAGYCYVAAPTREPGLGTDVAELGAMYVDPGSWRQGVGEALMRAALERLAGLPYSEVVLWTFGENERAVAFYERYGWRADGSEKIHARSGEPAIRMSRSLTMNPS